MRGACHPWLHDGTRLAAMRRVVQAQLGTEADAVVNLIIKKR
jgi:hypothetical protein